MKANIQPNMLSTCNTCVTSSTFTPTHTYTHTDTHSRARGMKNLQVLNLLPILALVNLFIKISGSVSLHPELTGPDKAFLGSKVAFQCIAPNSSLPVTYKLMKDGLTFARVVQVDQPALFFLKVAATFEGLYRCEAKTREGTGLSNSIRLSVVIPPSFTSVTSEPSPPVAFEGSRIVLICDVKNGSHLSYMWFFNKEKIKSSTSLLHSTGNRLVMENVTPQHAGYYYCMAWSSVEDKSRFSSSTEVNVEVKIHVSTPRISFSISKEGASYHANVTCWSSRGTPPVNFTLLVDDKEMTSVTATESLAATFPVTIKPDLKNTTQCRVKTEVQELMSEPVTLEVVPVGGDVKVEVEHLYRADSKLATTRLSCKVSRGTFPYVSWLLNDSVLPLTTHVDSCVQPVLPHYALVDHRQTLILNKLGPEESGYYRCKARDSYDDSGAWVESAAILVQVTDKLLNSMPRPTTSTETPPKVFMSTIEVITIIFCCTLLLILAVVVAFGYRMLHREQAHAHFATTNPSLNIIPLSALTSRSGGRQ
ncbi:hypothetical protein PAMA_016039 [Pampus argenteus]